MSTIKNFHSEENNWDELIANFDWSTMIFEDASTLPKQEPKPKKVQQTSQEIAREISKRSKERDAIVSSRYSAQSCRYEKALITINEKHNGEI